MGRCRICSESYPFISQELAVCLRCIREVPREALPAAMEAHRRSRIAFGLPEVPPQDPQGAPCNLCTNECRIPEGEFGFCGLRKNEGGRLAGLSAQQGKLSWYHDPHPTNCVADWVCPGGRGAGSPRYAHFPGPEHGYKNLAVFFHACSFNCLFCQNWHFREQSREPRAVSADKLSARVDGRTSCICYFGGDPGPQLPFALQASRLALKQKKGQILRICWETNGSLHPALLEEMVELSLESGGSIKFDLKAANEDLHIALTGVSNQRTRENFAKVGNWIQKRPDPPLLVASTLLVPGYIDEEEVREIARFIASIHPDDIPYSLLAFYPHFYLSDLPLTPRTLAEGCLAAAHEEGLNKVRIGNVHLLR